MFRSPETATKYKLFDATATRYSWFITSPRLPGQYNSDWLAKSNPRPPPGGWLDQSNIDWRVFDEANQWSDTFGKSNLRPPTRITPTRYAQWSDSFDPRPPTKMPTRYNSVANDISAWNDDAEVGTAIMSRWSSSANDWEADRSVNTYVQDGIMSRWSSSVNDWEADRSVTTYVQDGIMSQWSSSDDDFHASATAKIDPVSGNALENQVFLLNVDINGLWFILPCFVLWVVLAIYGIVRCKRRSKVNNSIMELNESFQDPEHVKYVASLTPAGDDDGLPRSASAERVYNML